MLCEMSAADPTGIFPDPKQRLLACQRPAGPPVMYQEWRDLLFLHWEVCPATIQARLPKGLFVDTFEGRAFLGLVPFFMRNIRPRFLPPIPGLSNFMELNLRTYVYDRSGVPGVWFYSLDANQPIAVEIARRVFHLPYEHARMISYRPGSGAIHYQSARRSDAEGTSRFDYTLGAELPAPPPESLEFFLLERYRLYAGSNERLWRGAVHHTPYPLRQADLTRCEERFIALNRFESPTRPPDHIIGSSGVRVSVFKLESIR
ncbi:MAG: DUF2071 domain-containing protein [Verrucomicrobia bacterium]|nr:DUF2071 domain-containing protein [Verrucomicrobiota bacterium]